MTDGTTALIYLPSSRALRWLRKAGPRRRDTAAALRVLAACDPAPAAARADCRMPAESGSSVAAGGAGAAGSFLFRALAVGPSGAMSLRLAGRYAAA